MPSAKSPRFGRRNSSREEPDSSPRPWESGEDEFLSGLFEDVIPGETIPEETITEETIAGENGPARAGRAAAGSGEGEVAEERLPGERGVDAEAENEAEAAAPLASDFDNGTPGCGGEEAPALDEQPAEELAGTAERLDAMAGAPGHREEESFFSFDDEDTDRSWFLGGPPAAADSLGATPPAERQDGAAAARESVAEPACEDDSFAAGLDIDPEHATRGGTVGGSEVSPTDSGSPSPRVRPGARSAAEGGGFDELGLDEKVLASIADLGFAEPTPIQSKAIPLLVQGHDLIGKAETGTGKTLAFMAPIAGRIDTERVATQCLVLCPTRELAQQVEEVARDLGRRAGIRTALVVGGVHHGSQILALREGAHIVVGTPGRVLEMLQERYLHLPWAHHVVLDEGDRMLDMGFIGDVMAILEHVPAERQMMLFSATVPPRLRQLTRDFMREPRTVSTVQGTATVAKIQQYYLEIHPRDKDRYLCDLLDRTEGDTCIVFCNTRRTVKDLDRTLWGKGYPAGALHGDQEQDLRFQILDAFKARRITTLVATDVAARGLDIEAVTRVVNYDVPEEVETYVHRIGRTGRAGGEGEAIVLVTRQDGRKWAAIHRNPQLAIERMSWRGGGRPDRARDGSSRPRRDVERGGGDRSRSRGQQSDDSRGDRERQRDDRRGAESRSRRVVSRGRPSDRQGPGREERTREDRPRRSRRANGSGDRRREPSEDRARRRESSAEERPDQREESRRSTTPDAESGRDSTRTSGGRGGRGGGNRSRGAESASDRSSRGSRRRRPESERERPRQSRGARRGGRRGSSEPRQAPFWDVSDDEPL